MQLTTLREADAEAFRSVGVSHRRTIISKVKEREERLFYMSACATNHYSVPELRRTIARDDWYHKGKMPSNFIQMPRPLLLASPHQVILSLVYA